MRKLLFATIVIALPLNLTACPALQNLSQNVQTVSDAQAAVGATAAAIAALKSPAPLLTKAAGVACAGQAIANATTDMLTATGNTSAAANSAAVAVALGKGCVWATSLAPAS